MKLRVLWVGKSRDAWLKDAIKEYSDRIRRYITLDLLEIRDEKGAEAEEMRRKESERLEKLIPPNALLILLDARGEQLDSLDMARFIEKERDAGIAELVFVIGGAYGFSETFRKRGKLLSLSKMTFTHQMVRIFLLEQIYRSFTIINREPYHHE